LFVEPIAQPAKRSIEEATEASDDITMHDEVSLIRLQGIFVAKVGTGVGFPEISGRHVEPDHRLWQPTHPVLTRATRLVGGERPPTATAIRQPNVLGSQVLFGA